MADVAPIVRRLIARVLSRPSRPSTDARCPSRQRCFHTLHGPFTEKCSSQTHWISDRSASSRRALADRRVGPVYRAFSRKYVDGAIGTTAQIGSTP